MVGCRSENLLMVRFEIEIWFMRFGSVTSGSKGGGSHTTLAEGK